MWGLELSELNPQLAEYFGAPNGKGILVEHVQKKSSGEKAGFKAGDVITKVNKNAIEELRDVRESAEDAKEGDKLEVEVLRKGSTKVLTVEVDDKDDDPSSFNFHFKNGNGMMDRFEFEGIPGEEMRNLELRLRESLPDMNELRSKIERVRRDIVRFSI